MIISLTPQRRNDKLRISKSGDILTLNGESFDFTSLPDGATIPAGIIPCDWISGPVERVGGGLHITVILPHGPNPPNDVLFPEPIIDPPDGEIVLPEASHVDA